MWLTRIINDRTSEHFDQQRLLKLYEANKNGYKGQELIIIVALGGTYCY